MNLKTDMPTLVLDDRQSPWFSWVVDGPTIKYVSSLPEAVSKAADAGHPCGYVIYMSHPGLQTSLGISSCRGSYHLLDEVN